MHKEIEEARALIRIIQELDESPFVTDKTNDLFNSVAALLALFDRMQQEPVVDISPNDRVVDVAGKMSPGRYRRELEELKDAK